MATVKISKSKFTITYDGKEGAIFVLKALGKITDKDGYVIDKKTKKHELDAWGRKFKPNKMIGIVRGMYITSLLQIFELEIKLTKKHKIFINL